MKMNISLMFILGALVTFTYFWEEKGAKKILKDRLYEGEAVELILKNLKLTKKDDEWFIKKYNRALDGNYSDLINRMLSGLEIIRKIDIELKKSQEYFSQSKIFFQINNNQLTLGDFSTVDKGFYILKGENLYLVKDSNDYEGVYKSIEDEEYKKYLNLKNFLESKMESLFPTQIIHSLSELKNIEFFKQGKTFKLMITQNETLPAVIEPLKTINLLSHLETLNHISRVISIHSEKTPKIDDVIVKIIATTHQRSTAYFLLNKYLDKDGLFIWNSELEVIIEVDSVEQTLFNATVSDFWQKKFSLINSIRTKKSIKFKFQKGSRKVDGEVPDTSKFSYTSDEYNLNSKKLNQIFAVLLNNTLFEQANFVRDERALKYDFNITIEGEKYSIKSQAGILNVYEHSTQLEFVFIKQKAALPHPKFEDFFTLKEKKP